MHGWHGLQIRANWAVHRNISESVSAFDGSAFKIKATKG